MAAWSRGTPGLLLALVACGGGSTPDFLDTWEPVGSLIVPRSRHSATELENGEVLVVGGDQAVAGEQDVAMSEIFDPDLGTFRPGPTFPADFPDGIAVRLIDGRILFAGGRREDGLPHSRARLYDPDTETVQDAATMSVASIGGSAVRVGNGDVLVGGDGVQRYDAQRDAWSVVESPEIRINWQLGTLLADDSVIASREDSASRTKSFVRLSSASQSQTPTTPPPFGITASPCELLPDGRVVFADTSTYDPETDSWMVDDETTLRVFGSGRLSKLPSGRVLFTGGRCTFPDDICAQSVAAIYSGTTDSLIDAVPMPRARVFHTATRLQSGAILVIGGDGDPDSPTTADLYWE